jgi:hypothetical protein
MVQGWANFIVEEPEGVESVLTTWKKINKISVTCF